MAKGDQSVPIPDIPGFLGNAKESARQVDAALKEIDKQIKKTVRDGKDVDKDLLIRQQKLLQVKRSTDEILKGQQGNKALEKFAKASKALVAGSIALGSLVRKLLGLPRLVVGNVGLAGELADGGAGVLVFVVAAGRFA